MQTADIILKSNNIFTGTKKPIMNGYIAITGNKISYIGNEVPAVYMGENTIIYELGDQVICPGFVDVHCFFTGYLLTVAGIDMSQYQEANEIIKEISKHIQSLVSEETFIARGLKSNFNTLTTSVLDRNFPNNPIILFHENGESCYMNTKAMEIYDFTPETCWAESYWKLLKYILNKREFSVPEFKKYLSMMNSKGITSIKEMGFDDFYGFTEELKKLEENNELSVRVHFMSQPVGAPMNLEYGQKMRNTFQGNFLRFSGYNQMTDGSISQFEAEMKAPYCFSDTCCQKSIDWDKLKTDVLAADSENFRFSLHAQGDGAISKTVDIFSECKKDPSNHLMNRHAITDLECCDPIDIERMGKLGIIAEIYPQIMSIANGAEKIKMIHEKIGIDRGKNYWNRRKMEDSGVIISCGTDLPLLYDDIPESIYHTVGGQFPEGGAPFNKENTLNIEELLRAWSYGGQYNLGQEKDLGTLEVGKLADIAILDTDIFHTPMENMRDVAIRMTIVDGKIVYKK